MELGRELRTAAGSLSTSQRESKSLQVRVGSIRLVRVGRGKQQAPPPPRVLTYLSSILGLPPLAGSSCSLQQKRLLALESAMVVGCEPCWRGSSCLFGVSM